jgi:nitroreductase
MAIERRGSRRTFDGSPVPEDKLERIEAACDGFRPWENARTVLVRDPATDVFRGIVGSYGKVTGAPHLLAMIGSVEALYDQRAGYTGEAIVLLATSLGVGTCWIGGFFDHDLAAALTDIQPDERILAVSPLGTPVTELSADELALRGFARSKHRKPAEKIAPGSDRWPAWAQSAVAACVSAPSAMNRQPWRFSMDGDALVISADSPFETPRVTRRLDCGIGMLHAELGAIEAGVAGRWIEHLGSGLEVARFVPAGL